MRDNKNKDPSTKIQEALRKIENNKVSNEKDLEMRCNQNSMNNGIDDIPWQDVGADRCDEQSEQVMIIWSVDGVRKTTRKDACECEFALLEYQINMNLMVDGNVRRENYVANKYNERVYS